MKWPRLQIVRGLPGSGKTTFANQHWPNLLKLEFDHYCYRGGDYAFTDRRNAEGQAWIRAMIGAACASGFDFVVTGVFSGDTEDLNAVIQLAAGCGYDVWLKTLPQRYQSIHNVRPEDLETMRNDFVPDAVLSQRMLDFRFGVMP